MNGSYENTYHKKEGVSKDIEGSTDKEKKIKWKEQKISQRKISSGEKRCGSFGKNVFWDVPLGRVAQGLMRSFS